MKSITLFTLFCLAPGLALGFDKSLEFIPVEPGEFVMGSPTEEKGHYPDEVAHKVAITKTFEMAKAEITQRVWKKVMGKLPRDVQQKGDDLPITYVSFEDVQNFLKRLRRMRKGDGYFYRLPTEAEWEYAARGGHRASEKEKRQMFPFGDSAKDLDQYGWSWSNSKVAAQPVAALKPNQLGLYDMFGNVWEWTEDKYTKDASKVPVHPDFGHPVNKTEGSRQVIRSGCWTRNARILRPAFRGHLPPSSDFGNLGVRLVRSATAL